MEEKQKKILIIEDDQFIRELYERQLKLAGYSVQTAALGKAGLELLNKDNYDLLMLDLNIPDVSGFQILEKLQANPKANMNIMILSNVAQDEYIKKGLELGAQAYIVKSTYTPQKVVEEVKSVIG